MHFAERTAWDLTPNAIAAALTARRERGDPVLDLTETNPTRCGLSLFNEDTLTPLASRSALRYDPDPRGMRSAREAVAAYESSFGRIVDPDHVLLTAGTSEAYLFLFRLLCNPGDAVLIPSPGYPLFDHLADIADVRTAPYRYVYADGWHLDRESLAIEARTGLRALLCIDPNNPTGTCLVPEEHTWLRRFCAERSLALIVDEVFRPFRHHGGSNTPPNPGLLSFHLNGISKALGLPQLKLSWVIVSGPASVRDEALRRLDVISDLFLTVNTPVQTALPVLLAQAPRISAAINDRITANRSRAERLCSGTRVTACRADGGWSLILRLPESETDESWALEFLNRTGVYVHPGHLFDIPSGSFAVLSLLLQPDLFDEGLRRIVATVEEREE